MNSKKILYITLITLITLVVFTISVFAAHVHRVSPGENLYQIANKYGVTRQEIINLNHLPDPDSIFVKQVLIIPEAATPGIYRVKAGDTLYTIARELKIPTKVLANINGLWNINVLQIHQGLYIPYRYRYPQKYTVQAGDTLYKIANNFGIGIDEILIINNMNLYDILNTGQIIKIPALKKQPPSPPGYKWPNYLKEYPGIYYLSGKTNLYQVAITFDDGPDGIYTPQILDILKEYGIPATFFLIGNRINNNPGIVERMTREGHIVANHSWSHVNLAKSSQSRVLSEIKNTENLVQKTSGIKTGLLRTPYGAYSRNLFEQARQLGYKVIHWSVDSQDWSSQDVDQILINTLPNVNKGSIILFHSAGGKGHDLSATVKVLPELIQTLRMIGFEFVGLDQLLNIPSYQN